MEEDVLRDKIDKNIICRLCLNVESEFVSIDSDISETNSRELITKFNLLNINDEVVVTSICSNCTETLLAIQNFHSICQNSSKTILDVVKSGKSIGSEEEEPKEDESSFEFLNIDAVSDEVETNDDDSDYHDNGGNFENSDESMNLSSEEEQEKETEEQVFLSCKFCSKQYKRQVHLDRHQKNAHKKDEKKVLDVKKIKYIKTCNLCAKRFTESDSYDKHLRKKNCVPEKPSCRFCKEQMESIRSLEKHLKKNHPTGKEHACPICSKTFSSVSNRNTHIQCHNQELSHFCDYCGRGCKSLLYLKKHLKCHIKADKVCTICDQKFDSQSKYDYHLKSHDPNKKYKCDFCVKSFLQHHHLESHIRVHTKYKPYVCEKCGKNFKQECNLKLHLKKHITQKDHECPTCGETFIEKTLYSKHLQTHSKFLCDFCGKGFKRKYALFMHEKTHVGGEFKCEPCNRLFVQCQQLKYHNYKHHNIGPPVSKEGNLPRRKPARVPLPYVCNVCNKCFKVPSSLASHAAVHTEDRKYKCIDCGNSFKRSEHLKIHINRIHLKQKLHVCPVCNKSFAQTGDMNLHMKKHESTRLYNCRFCSKSFKILKAKVAHENIHSDERPYTCGFKNCNDSFRTFTSLAKHTLTHPDAEIMEEVTKHKDELKLPDKFCVESLESQNIIIETIDAIDQETVVDSADTQMIPMLVIPVTSDHQQLIEIVFTE